MNGRPWNWREALFTTRFRSTLLAGDFLVVAWLAWTRETLLLGVNRAPIRPLIFGAAFALFALACGTHRPHPLPRRAGRLLAAAAVFAAGLVAFAGFNPGSAAWLAGASAALVFGFRLLHDAARVRWPGDRGEFLRWAVLGAFAVWTMRLFYYAGSIGAGDTYWYVTMLADFVTQLRAGEFPVWVGQSIYAFNGAISPLRLAPWFQHVGGVIDFLTWHALDFNALKNAILIANSLAGLGSAYVCLRLILPLRPWLAAVLAGFWLLSPGVFAALLVGDQYMTFMTLPFLPLALHACWRLWHRDDLAARLLLAVAVAGLWLCHTPIAIWTTFIVGAIYLARVVRFSRWRTEPGPMLAAALLFLALGSWPVVSALALHTDADLSTRGSDALIEIGRVFPANFLPISTARPSLESYQLGYSIIALFLASVVLTWLGRARSALCFVAAAIAITFLTLPVPFITRQIWLHLPQAVVAITNIWPMQRFFMIWSAVIVFGFAAALAAPRFATGSRLRWLPISLLVLGGFWSFREGEKLIWTAAQSRAPVAESRTRISPDNALLVRYTYGGFGWVPAYASHGYMDPFLENRLLDPRSGELRLSNADAAAPAVSVLSGEPYRLSRAVAAGHLPAVNDNGTDFYKLTLPQKLEPGVHYALRVAFTEPGLSGILQVLSSHLFREYIFPDSGSGLAYRGPPRSFGSLPESSRVLPLAFRGDAAETPLINFITPRRAAPEFNFGRYWLYRYEPADLPITVQSWVPYRSRVRSGQGAILETPRLWLQGWEATVDRQPVGIVRTANNLVGIPVPAGISQVELSFHPPMWVQLAYYCCLLSWCAVGGFACLRLVRLGAPARR